MRKRDFQLLVVSPAALVNPSLAIAASRAKGLGVLDLTYARDEAAALSAVATLARYRGGSVGVKLDGCAEPLVAKVT
ncbi:MAG: hypothetical protein ACREJP_04545, partial [Candidatus Methylomirabilales bacterium]